MIADQPLVLYESDRKIGKKEMDDLSDKWHAMRKGKTLAGQEVSLSDYLRKNVNQVENE